jgi:hypothetical protein
MLSSADIDEIRAADLALFNLRDLKLTNVISTLIENYPDFALKLYHELSKEYT